MDYKQFIESLTPEVYKNLKLAVELGKWPNGKKLTREQMESCLQAVIAYDHHHKPETMRVGYIHSEKEGFCDDNQDQVDEFQPLRWE